MSRKVIARAIAAMTLGVVAGAPALPAAAGTLSGTAIYLERIALPPDAVFEAVVQDVSRMDAPARAIGRYSQSPAGSPPFRFDIFYDESALDPRARYAVRASVTHQGRLLFTTDTHIAVLDGANQPVEITMVSAGHSPQAPQTGAAPPSPLRNTYWKLTSLRGKPAVAGTLREPHLVFAAEEDRVSGSSGCNGLIGAFEADGDKLTLSRMAGTLMACPSGMEQEREFLTTLPATASYRIEGDRLELRDAQGGVLARFQAVALN